MTEPTFHSGRSTQNLKLIEIGPAQPGVVGSAGGKSARPKRSAQHQKPRGHHRRPEENRGGQCAGQATGELARFESLRLSKSMFTRLARAYNSPDAAEGSRPDLSARPGPAQCGAATFRALDAPGRSGEGIAAVERGGGGRGAAADVATHRRCSAGHSGITAAQHAQAGRDGNHSQDRARCSCPRGPTSPPTTKMTPPARVSAAAEPLPATTRGMSRAGESRDHRGESQAGRGAAEEGQRDSPPENTEMWQLWTDLGQAYFEAGNPPRSRTCFRRGAQV